MLDEHGLPVPVCGKVIVEQFGDEYHLLVDGEDGFQVVLTFCKTRDAAEFLAHAINHITPCREIVRRLVEAENWPDRMMVAGESRSIAEDATKLWADMQRNAKGGDSGST